MKGESMRNDVITEADTCREFVTPRSVEASWNTEPNDLIAAVRSHEAEVQA